MFSFGSSLVLTLVSVIHSHLMDGLSYWGDKKFML